MENKITLTENQLADTVAKAVAQVKDEEARNKPFATNFQIKSEVETNPNFVGAFVRAQMEAKRLGLTVQEAAKRLMESTKSYASEVVAKGVNETTLDEGGYLTVPEVSNQFIELLNAKTIFRSLPGVQKITMRSNSLEFNKATTGANAYWGPEAPAPAKNAERFGKLTLTPKQLTSWSTVSNLLIADSPFQAERIVQDEIIRKMAVAEDNAFLTATGASYTPVGLRGQIAAGNVVSTTGTSTEQYEADFFNAESKVRVTNHMGQLTWIMNFATYSTLRTKLRVTTGQIAFPELRDPAGPSLLGYPVVFSNPTANPSAKIFLVENESVIIADRAGLNVMINPPQNDATFVYSPFETLILASLRVDFGLKYDTAASVIE